MVDGDSGIEHRRSRVMSTLPLDSTGIVRRRHDRDPLGIL
jgi:hypothetical protein